MAVSQMCWQVGTMAYQSLTDLLFPPNCLICSCEVDLPFHCPLYCEPCLEKLVTPLKGSCFRCGIKLPFRIDGAKHVPMVTREQTSHGCPDCRRRKWAFDRVVAIGSYEGLWRDHVYQLKRPHHSADAFQAGKLLGQRLLDSEWWTEFDALVPLPIHWRRQLTRGFNQALRIAEGIHQVIPLPVANHTLVSQRFTLKQGTLSATARMTNVQKSMSIRASSKELRGKRVILVDDVLTTGATANVAARLCKQAGAIRVAVAVVARAGRF